MPKHTSSRHRTLAKNQPPEIPFKIDTRQAEREDVGMPYEDVENLRPETKKMVETWLKVYGDAKDVVLGVESAGN